MFQNEQALVNDEHRDDTPATYVSDRDGTPNAGDRHRPPSPRRHAVKFDTELVRDQLSIFDVLDDADIRNTSNRMPCPVCENPEASFSVYDEDRRFKCHRGSCGAHGDVFALLMKLHGLDFSSALAHAAQLAGVTADEQLDPQERVAREAKRTERREQAALEQRIKTDESIKYATETWFKNQDAYFAEQPEHCFNYATASWEKKTRRDLCGRYLTTRGLGELADKPGYCRDLQLAAWKDGAPCTPLYGTVLVKSPTFSRLVNPIVNVGTRSIPVRASDGSLSDPDPKARVLPGCTTVGTFGSSQWLREQDYYGQVVIVEGIIDYFTAYLVPWPERSLVLGAQSASQVPRVVTSLADDPTIGPLFRAMKIVLVTHQDNAGRENEAKAVAAAAQRGFTLSHFPLGSHNDLNDWWVA